MLVRAVVFVMVLLVARAHNPRGHFGQFTLKRGDQFGPDVIPVPRIPNGVETGGNGIKGGDIGGCPSCGGRHKGNRGAKIGLGFRGYRLVCHGVA